MRVQPHGVKDDFASAAFDPDAWRDKLSSADLDARERAFERVVELARTKKGARESLEAWAQDAHEPELAWTSRLALRELEKDAAAAGLFGSHGWNDLHSRFDQLRQRFDTLDPMFQDMQQDLERLFAQQPPSLPHGGQGSQKSFSLRVEPDGVTCEITENVDGQSQTRKFEAKSLDELLAAHPELREQIGTGHGVELFGVPGWKGRAFGGAPLARAPWSTARPSGSPPTDILGIECTKLDAAQLESMGLEPELGLHVERTAPGTIADLLGIQRGDLVIELNGTPLYGAEDVGSVLRKRDPDAEVLVVLIDKKGQRRTLTWKPSAKDDGSSQD